MELHEILSRLQGVRGSGTQYVARCPAHDDKKASLAVSEKDGKLLLYCHAGCTLEEITAAMGIQPSELSPRKAGSPVVTPPVEYMYTDPDGNAVLKKIRTAQKDFFWQHKDDDGQWKNGRNGITPPIFGLYEAKGQNLVYIVEGEKDVLTLKKLGQAAVSLADGAKSKWHKEYRDYFKGKEIVLLPDNDEPGRNYAAMLSDKLVSIAESVKVVDLAKIWPDMPEHADISDYVAAFGRESFENVLTLAKNTPTRTAAGTLKIMSMNDIAAEQVDWLWKPYIPSGKITLITADPGMGKTFFCLYLAATVSTGRRFWGQLPGEHREPGRVIYQTAEDGLADTLKPRLIPMEPDFKNILVIDESEEGLSLSDERIEAAMKLYHPALMIFDPLQAYLGAEVDMHRANEVRPVMAKIAHLAEEYKCAVVFIMHNSKMGQNQALYRSLGSIDIPAIARSMLIMGKHPEIENQRLIFHEKSSLAAHGQTMAVEITPQFGGLSFCGYSEYKADDVLNARIGARSKPSVKKEDVAEKLLELLNAHDGVVSLEQVEQMQREHGWSKPTMYRAKDDLKIKSLKLGFSEKKTWWMLPDTDEEAVKREKEPPEQITFEG